MGNNVLNSFLQQLEGIIIEIEDRISELISQNREYNYIDDLLVLLNNSIVDYVLLVEEADDEKKNFLNHTLKKVINDEEKYERITQETSNLYFLIKNDMYDKEEVKVQRDSSLNYLRELIDLLIEYQSKIDKKTNERNIQVMREGEDKIIRLGSVMDDSSLDIDIDDFNFLQKLIEYVELSDLDRIELLALCVNKNVEVYKKKLKHEDDLKNYYEILSKEKIEEPKIIEIINYNKSLLNKNKDIEILDFVDGDEFEFCEEKEFDFVDDSEPNQLNISRR